MMSDSNFDFYDDGDENNEKKTNENEKDDDKFNGSYSDKSNASDTEEISKRSESSRRHSDYSDEENNNDNRKNDDDYSDDDRHSPSQRSPSPTNGNASPYSDRGSSRHSRSHHSPSPVNGDISPRSDRSGSHHSDRSGSHRSSRSGSHRSEHKSSRQNSSNSRKNSSYSRYSSVDSNAYSRESSVEKKESKPKKKPPIQNGVARKNAQNKTSGRGRGRGTGKRPAPVSGRQEKNAVVDRVLSANRHKSRALHNVIHELQQQVDALTIENRDLQRVARLQEKEIRKLNDDEAQLPSLLHKHNADLRVKEGKIKKQKEELDKLRETVKRREAELRKTQDKLTKYEDLVKQKNLLEANELSKKVESLQRQLEDRDKKIADLSKNAQVKDKNLSRDLRISRDKLKNATEQCKLLENENDTLKQKLKEKEKVLNSMNIYTIKTQNNPDRPLFTPTEPMPYLLRRHQEEEESQYAESVQSSVPPSEVSVAKSSKPIGSTQQNNKVEKKQPKKAFATPVESPRGQPIKTMVGERQISHDHSDNDDEDFYAGKKSEEENRLEEIERKLAEINRKEEELKRKEEAELEKSKQQEELRRQYEFEEQQRKEKEELEKKRREEEQERIEEETRKREAEENARRLEEERENTRRSEREAQEREKERQAIEEDMRKKEEEEKRKKKELLIARMKAIDNGEDPDKIEVAKSSKPDSSKKKKPIFLESNSDNTSNVSKQEDALPNEPLDFSSQPTYSRRSTDESIKNKPQGISRRNTNESVTKSERRNSWDFKPTDENLHRGLPAHSGFNNDSPKLSRRNTQDSIGSGKSSGRNARNRRAQLLDEDLDTSYSPSSLNNSPAPSANNTSSAKKTGKSPFDQFEDPFGLDKPKKKKEKNKLVFSSDEDDDLDAPSYQPSKAPVKKGPVVNNNRGNFQALDQDDDDLEEMTLG